MQPIDPQDQITLKAAIDGFKEKYDLSSPAEVLAALQIESIPATIFNDKLSPLETVVKFLKENNNKKLAEIARILKKDVSSVWLAYKHSQQKHPKKITFAHTPYTIPISVLHSSSLSLLETITEHLRDKYGLSYHDLGKLLSRNERTVWTTYRRAKQKHTLGDSRG